MKETPNRGYAYPECSPPFVKDAADLPLQLKTFADKVDDDVTALQATAQLALNPPSASITASPTTFDPATNRFLFNVVEFDNASMANLALDGLVAPEPGLYTIIGIRSYTASALAGTQLSIQVNGAIIETSSINPDDGAGIWENTVIATAVLAAGDLITMHGVEPTFQLDGTGALQAFMDALL